MKNHYQLINHQTKGKKSKIVEVII